MRRILAICPYVPEPPTHGGSIRSRVLLQALASDHQLTVAAACATAEDRTNLLRLGRGLDAKTLELPALDHPRSRLSHKLRHWCRGLASELLHRRWTEDSISRAHQTQHSGNFDLVAIDSSYALPLRQPNSRMLLHLHNLEHQLFARRDHQQRPWPERITRYVEALAIRRAERRALRQAALTITVSAADRELALTLAPGARVETVPNTVDLQQLPLQPPAPAGPPRLLFVGSLDYPPNQEAVAELVQHHLPLLRQHWPQLVVRIVGRDPRQFLTRYANNPGVEAIGTVDQVLPHYAASHAVYLPIRSGGGTRIKILEAFAAGVPVLTTAIGCEGLPVVAGRDCLLFETAAEGADALRTLLAGASLQLRDNARQLVATRFSQAAAIQRMRQLITELVDHR